MKYKVGDRVITIKEKDKYDTMLFPIGTVGIVTGINPNEKDGLIYKVVEGIDGIDGYWWYSEDMLEPFNGKTYSDGLADAWELARKIVLKAEMGGICFDDFKKIFGVGDYVTVLRTLSPQEALAKIEAYEVSQQIQVGDVVKVKDKIYEFIVTAIKGDGIQGVDSNGYVYMVEKERLVKIGRHIDISNLLEQIRGNE